MIRFLLLAGLMALPAQAAEPIVVDSGVTRAAVVELYTSEGCSSCPPADRWLSRLVATPRDDADVLALSFHVDYWNYLGWEDRFSSADYTSRQRQLGANNLQRTIYTPEFFVNGMEARGSGAIVDKIREANATPAPLRLRLSVSRDQTGLLLDLHVPGDRVDAQHRYLVYENNLSTDVRRGENAGETLNHQRVVRYMSRAQSLREDNRHRIEISPDWNPLHIGVAVLVTTPGSREYLQALHTDVSSLLAGGTRSN
jgi:hypothetical protein